MLEPVTDTISIKEEMERYTTEYGGRSNGSGSSLAGIDRK